MRGRSKFDRDRLNYAGGADRDAEIGAQAQAYAPTGVDAMDVVGVRDRVQRSEISSVTALLLLFTCDVGNECGSPLEMRSYGVRLWVDSHAPDLAAVQASCAASRHVRDHEDSCPPPAVASDGRVAELSRCADVARWINESLGGAP